MQVGFIGLGKMGCSMVLHLLERGHEVVVYDLSPEAVAALTAKGAKGAGSLEDLASLLAASRIIWMMVPAGEAVDRTIDILLPLLARGDMLIDGGNSRYTDSVRRAQRLDAFGIDYLDAGTSGGLEGARHGSCVMVGGRKGAYEILEPLFKELCVENGYAYMGPSGAGHFAKMVHNGIEYGMMQAIGEGFDLLDSSEYDFQFAEVAALWAHGSVIRGWLMELVQRAFQKEPRLSSVSQRIEDSGEGRWTVEAALEQEVSIPVIAASLFSRYRSRSEEQLSDRVVSALRHEFGGHASTSKP